MNECEGCCEMTSGSLSSVFIQQRATQRYSKGFRFVSVDVCVSSSDKKTRVSVYVLLFISIKTKEKTSEELDP